MNTASRLPGKPMKLHSAALAAAAAAALILLAALALLTKPAAAAAADAPASDAGGTPLLATPSGPPPAPIPRSADADAATYARCMKLAQTDPAGARKLAEDWKKRRGAHPAEHCYAVALIGLGRYQEGAEALDNLAEAMVQGPATLRAGVLGQAAQAWLLADDAPRAYADDSAALDLHPDDPDLLVDRAEAAGSAGWPDKALADLDAVLKHNPTRLDALIYRASAYRKLGQLDPALADADAALKQSPESVPALLERGNIRRLQGNTEGARQDWQRIAALAPDSAAAKAAKANIERLDALGVETPTPQGKP
jgi:tetratricopeptide (TPR) repeat protein